jgi:hypothetical protein
MTTFKAIIFASLSLLFSSFTYTMELVVEHQPSKQQKNALTAFMFKGALQSPKSLKKHNPLLLHHDGDFHIIEDGKHSKIPFENIKGLKEKITPEQFKAFIENGGYFWLNKNDQNDYFLEAKLRAFGGGLGGATWGVTVGHFLGNVVVYSGIGITSAAVGGVTTLVAGPAAGALATQTAFYSLQSTVVPLAQPFIHSVAIAGGIAGAVATGPV